jgi:polar amino acid transport system substrate-binding protein
MHRALLFAAVALSTACTSVATAPDAVATLAPTGMLRVGLYPGTPTSIIGVAKTGTAKGVGYDLGKALAASAGVRFEPIVFEKNADVLAAARSGHIDMVFTNATSARRQDLDFSPPVLDVEQGYLVAARSTIAAASDVDRPGLRVGVSEGSTSQGTLSRELRNARVVTTPSLKAAIEMLGKGELDAFATNKATLFEMADDLPGSRVLPGRFGVETFAIGIPKGRAAGLPVVDRFVQEAKAQGAITRAIERAGLRGATPAS